MQIFNLKNRPEHINKIAKLLFDQWGHLRPGSTLDSAINRVEMRYQGDGIPSIFVAEIDSEPAGTVSIVKHDMDIRKDLSPWIASLYVAEEFRHQKIGRKLITFIESYAKEIGVKKTYLFTPDKQKMYSLLGWRHFENIGYQSKMVTIMAKNL
ncbi:GNAT family N-acetyltransferase [Thermodesulfobacteriota bacterium]